MTLEELRKLDHDIYVFFEEELCRVVVEDGDVYLLTNNCNYNGSKPSKMHGYAYSWWLCDNFGDSDDQRLQRYFKPAKRRPL